MARVCSGMIKFVIDGTTFHLRGANPSEKVDACELYEEALEQGKESGLFSESDWHSHILSIGLWSEEQEAALKHATETVSNLKMVLFQNFTNPFIRGKTQQTIENARKKSLELAIEKGKYDNQTAEYYAMSLKMRYLVGKGLLRADAKTPVYSGDEFLSESANLVDSAIAESGKKRPSEAIIREIARNEPWRSIWACRHSENIVFGTPAAYLTDDQKHLCVWSRLYDNSYEDSEHPSDEVYDCDDAFDGWLLLKREGKVKDGVTGNEKISNSGEVFVVKSLPGEAFSSMTTEEREDVEKHNNQQAVAAKKARSEFITKVGSAPEAAMPDTQGYLARQMRMRGAGNG